jgi:iron(III) transport system substrate-binding protein
MRLTAISSVVVMGLLSMLSQRGAVAQAVPHSERATDSALAAAAKLEGTVVVYSTIDPKLIRFLVDDFEQMYPGVKVANAALDPVELDSRFTKENTSDGHSADVVWSAAMDRQMECVRRGCALAYASPEAGAIPTWAKWKDRVYGTTYEPIVIVYNRRFVQQGEVPTTHAALTKLLSANPEKYQGKVSTYDPERNALGSLLLSLDAKYDPQFWKLVNAMGSRGLETQASTDIIFDRISSGQNLIAYDILGSDAVKRAKRDPTVGVQYTVDYNLVLSRLILIAKNARHPNAAKLWLDYVLSKRGQQQMQIADLYPIREDVTNIEPGLALLRRLPGVAKPITADSSLAQIVDNNRRRAFQNRWNAALGAKQ